MRLLPYAIGVLALASCRPNAASPPRSIEAWQAWCAAHHVDASEARRLNDLGCHAERLGSPPRDALVCRTPDADAVPMRVGSPWAVRSREVFVIEQRVLVSTLRVATDVDTYDTPEGVPTSVASAPAFALDVEVDGASLVVREASTSDCDRESKPPVCSTGEPCRGPDYAGAVTTVCASRGRYELQGTHLVRTSPR